MTTDARRVTVNPSIVLMTWDDPPEEMRSAPISDPVARARLAKLKGELAEAPAGKRPILEREYGAAEREATPKFTVGRAISNALMSVLPDDEKNKIEGSKKVDFMEWAMRLKKAQIAGPAEVATFTNTEAAEIKARVSAAFPSALVAAQVLLAFVAEKDPE